MMLKFFYRLIRQSMLRSSDAHITKPTSLFVTAVLTPLIVACFLILSTAFGLLLTLTTTAPQPAFAQGGSETLTTHTTVGDFGAVCGTFTNVSISSAGGGEIRLSATVEDYFDDTVVDSNMWLSGFVYNWYTDTPPSESGGLLNLNGSYLRSQATMNQTGQRFFEARVLLEPTAGQIGWSDVGFYRQYPPLAYTSPITEQSSFRLFITSDTRDMIVLSRDGGEETSSIGGNVNPDPDMTQFHNLRIEWDNSESRYYVDGNFADATSPSGTSLPSWVFLYAQTPQRLIQIDWVRAGQYSPSGTFISCTQDAGEAVDWTTLTGVTYQPTGTGILISTRTSNDGVNWSGWEAVSANTIASPDGRYLQYRLDFTTSNLMASSEVQSVTFGYQPIGAPTATPVPTDTPVPPTNTPTPVPTNTPGGPTDTPTPVPTNTPVPPTATPTPTNTPVPPTTTPTPVPTNTPVPPTATPTPDSSVVQTPTGPGLFTHTAVGDFGAVCGTFTDVSVSSAGGGELRLAASVEDYFDDTVVDSNIWLSGFTYEWYTDGPPTEANGVITLDGSYVRSQITIDQPLRFYEARARLRINGNPPGWPDLGFYRQFAPLTYGDPITEQSSIRIFVTPNDERIYARARDGGSSEPLIDEYLDPIPNFTQFHNFRIEWDQSETRYYIDGQLESTMPGISSLPSWAWIYHQDPSSLNTSPIEVDWLRAGQYSASGTFISCAQDAGEAVDWTTLTAVSYQPTGTGLSISTRSSNDGVNWSGWEAVSADTIASPDGRYLQYRAEFSTSNPMASTELQDVNIAFQDIGAPTNTPTPTNTPGGPTDTPAPPTPTPTNTPIPPTATPTPTNTATPVPPVAGSGLSFDGNDDLVRAGQVSNIGPLTLEAWVRPAGNGSNGLLLVQTDDNNGWSLELNGGRLTFWLSTNQGWQSVQHNTALQGGQWYHVAATYNSGTARVFVNGNGSNTSNVGTLTQGPSLNFGGLDGYSFFNGTMDEVRISNVVRYTANFSVPTAPFVSDGNTLGLWSFDENTGQTAADSSASGNNGTLGSGGGADGADPTWVTGYPFPSSAPTPTNTPTATPVPPTNTPTNTPVPPTPTPTNTPGGPTDTPVPPTPTPTNTPIPPTATPTPTNTATPIPPVAGSGLSFDGNDDLVRAGQVSNIGPLTLEAWVRPAANNSEGLILVQTDDNNGWSLELNGGRLTFWLSTNQGWQSVQHNSALQGGQWYHVAATYSNGSARVFVNGNGSNTSNVGTLTQGPSLNFGGLNGYSFFNGTMDEVRISNIVRYTANFSIPTAPFVSDGNTLGLWSFDENTGQTAADSSASGNNGTLGSGGGADGADPTWVTGYPF